MLKVLKNWKINPIAYAQSQGEPKFLQALQKYYHHLGHTFVKLNNLQVTTGGSEGLLMAMLAIANPGDEIIIFEPFYTNYNSFAAVTQVKLKPISTSIKNGFHLPDKKTIEKAITKKTKAILYCNPNNPTGTAYSKKEIELLVQISQKHKLYLLADEVYREFIYDKKKQTSLLSYMKKIPQQAVLLDSLSKRYSLCGARLGMITSLNQELMAGILRIAQGRLSSGLIDQKLAAKLIQIPASYFDQVRDEYQRRRDLLFKGLRKIPGVIAPKPEGAFYMIASLPITNSEDFCRWLLTDFHQNKETVMLAPAAGFYATKDKGSNEVRIAYVLNLKDLSRCLNLLNQALNIYQQ